MEYDSRSFSRYGVDRALHYQLGERMLFVKPADPVVADLLYGFATVKAHTGAPKPAMELLQLSREYGYHDTADLDAKHARYQSASIAKKVKQWIPTAILIVVALCACLVFGHVMTRSPFRSLYRILTTGA